eukprot:TRINITY_DN1305_c0_g1_i4.p1 TRINITY_DN1305_c0_g1~~TRINITY_DN1305_c0_g1_i4.p1  ORF type:complete len:149 (+),score=12.07 TRINITY_DN1305_c0_g1_i4:523-969(+)
MDTKDDFDEEKPIPIYLRIQTAYFQTVSCNAVIVILVFWTMLYTPGSTVYWTSLSMHGVNGIFVLIEFFSNNIPYPFENIFYAFIPACFYCVFTWAVYFVFSPGFLPYSFLAITWFNTLYYIGVLLSFGITFSLMYGLHQLKNCCRPE